MTQNSRAPRRPRRPPPAPTHPPTGPRPAIRTCTREPLLPYRDEAAGHAYLCNGTVLHTYGGLMTEPADILE